MNTDKKNARKRHRGAKNLFYLTLSRRIQCHVPLLFRTKPYLEDLGNWEYADDYIDGKIWESFHSYHFPKGNLKERFPELSYKDVIPVKLILMGTKCWDGVEEKPDLYIQRVRDNLYIDNHYYTSYIGGNYDRKCLSVAHGTRISNKLFPDVTEESGIVGVKIVKI